MSLSIVSFVLYTVRVKQIMLGSTNHRKTAFYLIGQSILFIKYSLINTIFDH
jgi:hypothetical protein